MANRRAFLKAAGAGTAAAIAGCMDSGEEEAVHYLTYNSGEEFQEFFDNVAEDFTEETGIEAEVEYVGGFSVIDRLSTLLQSDDPPSAFAAPSSGAGGLMWSQGNTEPVTDIVDEFESTYGTVADYHKFPPVGSELHNVPHYQIVGGMEWYRSDIYQDGFGDTWDNYLSKFEEHDSDDMRAAFVPAAPAGMSGRYLNNFGAANGLGMATFEDDPAYLVDDYREGWIETLEFIGEVHNYSNSNAEASFVETPQAIVNGSAAWLSHFGRAGLIAARQDVEFKDQLAIGTPPSQDGEPEITGFLESAAGGILSSDIIGETRVENSKEFLRFLYGLHDDNPQRYIDFVNADAFIYLPVVDDLLDDELYTTSEPYETFPILQDYLDILNEEIMPNAAAGNDIMMAQPFWGVMDTSQGLAQMVNDHLIVDKSAEQAFDDNEPDLREAFDSSVSELEEAGVL